MAANQQDLAIKVDNVNKTFKLPHEKQTSIKSLFINLFRSKRTFEKQQVLKNISFEIKKGEFFGIVGRNGSGKSTLLKLLAGIYSPDEGAIKVNGTLTPFIELGVGFNQELTGRENVFLNGALLGFSRPEMNNMYDEIVEFAELERFMDQKLKNYSSGMQVRLAFSIAIRARSDVLLIDEVLAVGDALFQKKCFEYFAELKKQDRTVIFVSHDSESLLRFCDKGILIDKGKTIEIADIQQVVDAYREILMEEDIKKDHIKTTTSKEEPIEKKVTISSCRARNKTGYTNTFKYLEDIELDIDLKTKTKVNSLNIAIGIYNGQYEAHADRVIGASTQIDKLNLPLTTTRVRFKLDSPPLREGSYLVYVVVFGESEEVPYDYAWEVVNFNVKGAPRLQSRGVIIANHEWKFE